MEGSLDSITDELLDWLKEAKDFPQLTPEQLAELERLSNDELMRRFQRPVPGAPDGAWWTPMDLVFDLEASPCSATDSRSS